MQTSDVFRNDVQGAKLGVKTASIRLAPYVYGNDGAAF